MNIYILLAIIPVVLAVALIVALIRRNITENRGGGLDIAPAIPAIVVLMIAILVIVPMAQSTQDYLYDEGSGELVIQKNIPQLDIQPWDEYADEVKTLVIKDGVTIGSGVFDSLTSLEYVSIGEDVTLGTNVFGVAFKSPSKQTVQPGPGEYIGSNGTLYYCDPTLYSFSSDGKTITGLASGAAPLVIAPPSVSPDGAAVTAIGSQAFRNNATATDLFMNPQIGTVGNLAFGGMTSLATATLTPAVYGTGLFNGSSALTTAVLPEGMVTIPNQTFTNCTSLSHVEIPDSVTEIGDSAFNHTALTSISLPNVTSIGGQSFYNIPSLTTVDMPKIATVGNSAFQACGLTSVYLPATLTSIGNAAFNNISSIASVAFAPGFTAEFAAAMPSWTFYDSDGTTVLEKTPANMAGHAFQGTRTALVMVSAGQLNLTPQQIEQVNLHTMEDQDLDIQPMPFQPAVQTQDQEPVSA